MNAIGQIAKGMRHQEQREMPWYHSGGRRPHDRHREVEDPTGAVEGPNLMIWTGWAHLPILDIKDEG